MLRVTVNIFRKEYKMTKYGRRAFLCQPILCIWGQNESNFLKAFEHILSS